MASLDDVARAAGVSTATVSRALSGRGRTSDATRERVRAVAAELGYVASATASSLASGRAENVGVVVPLMDRWFFATVLDGIASRLAPRGYDLTLYNVTDDPDQRRRVFEVSLRRGRVDALVVLSVALSDDELARLRGLGLPLIGLGVPHAGFAGPRVDDTAVGRAATEHLLRLGHRDVAHIGQRVGQDAAADPAYDIPTRRYRGFEQAMADAAERGVPVVARFADSDFTVEGGRAAASALLADPHPPTAIFAASDELAYGVLAAAREAGVAVPAQLSVIGVDGHALAGLFGLTTIDQFPHAQGERVGDAVLAALGEPPAHPVAEALPFTLVPGTTTAPPPPPAPAPRPAPTF